MENKDKNIKNRNKQQKKLFNLLHQSNKEQRKKNNQIESFVKNSSFQISINDKKKIQRIDGSIILNSKVKIPENLSLNKIQQINSQESTVIQCLICFDKIPDAVLMSCGHGGICIDCACEIWNKANKCYICREPIMQILQIDLYYSGEYKPIISVTQEQQKNE